MRSNKVQANNATISSLHLATVDSFESVFLSGESLGPSLISMAESLSKLK